MPWSVPRRSLLARHTLRCTDGKRAVWQAVVSGVVVTVVLASIFHQAIVGGIVGVIVVLAVAFGTPYALAAWSFLTGWEIENADPLLLVEPIAADCVFKTGDSSLGPRANAWVWVNVTRLSPHKDITITGGLGDFVIGGKPQHLTRNSVQVRNDQRVGPFVLDYNVPVRLACYFNGIGVDGLVGDLSGTVTLLDDKERVTFPPISVILREEA